MLHFNQKPKTQLLFNSEFSLNFLDQKDWEFYLIVVGIPVLVILFFAATIALCYRYSGKRKYKDSSVYMSSSYVNSAHSVGKL